VSAYGLIQTARGMCSDEEPHHKIDALLAQAADAAHDVEKKFEEVCALSEKASVQREGIAKETLMFRAKINELQSDLNHLQSECRVCKGLGAIPGFWLGLVKTCPACHGKGRQ